jgi:hypothetical protein
MLLVTMTIVSSTSHRRMKAYMRITLGREVDASRQKVVCLLALTSKCVIHGPSQVTDTGPQLRSEVKAKAQMIVVERFQLVVSQRRSQEMAPED